MAEEKTTTRASRGPVKTEITPVSHGPDPDGQGEILSVKDANDVLASEKASAFSELRAFIAYRRAEIYRPRLGGVIGGAAAMNAAQSESVLKELEKFADWLDAGQPKPGQILSEVDKDFYRAAVARGLPVPEEITRQL